MINAKEIRQGNYIIDPEFINIPSLVDEIQSDGFIVTTFNDHLTNEKAEGILLTDEVLLKCDFKIVNHIHGYSFYTLGKSKKNRCHIDIYPTKTSWMSYSVKHCQFLHELQNLFFCLTGEELVCLL